ncbi:hypothetical protein SAMN04489844_1464 [Nocardioides exalbidus]|uniref:PIN domain-containing protein n=1 Tax=Nocardioides exalbidus TaxID=402596 RepID=A0A1H4NWX1_9ACTN|nr:hypothetical protein [Nocardioides exalbidus]SEB99142.1 hypothetical protein SAMN04489844_1464 [Nocardioides exalbidus]
MEPLVVVFDVNIYLDVARLIGAPFNTSALSDALARENGKPAPHRDPKVDSARALVIARSGFLAGTQRLEAWTSDHINALVRHKAKQLDDEALLPEDRGLGWTAEHAQGLLDDLLWQVIEGSGGDTVGNLRYPEHSPPLDHEDGMVLATALAAADGDLVCDRILVTRDRRFIEKCAELGHPRVMHPSQFVMLASRARSQAAMSRMRPRPANTRQPES